MRKGLSILTASTLLTGILRVVARIPPVGRRALSGPSLAREASFRCRSPA